MVERGDGLIDHSRPLLTFQRMKSNGGVKTRTSHSPRRARKKIQGESNQQQVLPTP